MLSPLNILSLDQGKGLEPRELTSEGETSSNRRSVLFRSWWAALGASARPVIFAPGVGPAAGQQSAAVEAQEGALSSELTLSAISHR